MLVARFQANARVEKCACITLYNFRVYARCSRSAENASEPVRVREGSETLVGYNPLFIYRARFPTSAPIVLRSTAGWQRGPRGTVLNPAARVYSQPAAVAYRGKLAGRSVPTDRGACTGSVPFDACRPGKGEGGSPCEPRARARARAGGDTSLTESTPAYYPGRRDEARGERGARGRGKHTPRRATSTRTTRAAERREDDRAGGRDYRE